MARLLEVNSNLTLGKGMMGKDSDKRDVWQKRLDQSIDDAHAQRLLNLTERMIPKGCPLDCSRCRRKRCLARVKSRDG